METLPLEKILLFFQRSMLAIFILLLLLQALATLDWRMEHDTPLVHYGAFLMDRYHLVPYRDFWETSLPGIYVFHYIIGKLFGYGDFAFRCVDLVLLCALLVTTFVFMSRFGRLAAAWAAVLFGLLYFSKGQTMSLQRDYIGVILIAFALLCLPATMDKPVSRWRFAIIGLLFGMAVLIKPHLVIGLPVIFGALLAFRWHSQSKSTRDFLQCAALCSTALLALPVISLLWLAARSALAPFVAVFFHYFPLYSVLTGWAENVSSQYRLFYLVEYTLKFGGYAPLLIASLFAYYLVLAHAWGDKVRTISVLCLCCCTFAYAVYPTLAGKFWEYHYMPLAYFCSLSAGLCFFARPKPPSPHPRLWRMIEEALPSLIFIVAVIVQLQLPRFALSLYTDLRTGPELHAPKNGRVDEIAGWLKARLKPGDTVQALDWTGGAIHAMLLAEAKPATRFLFDFHFYHHVSSPVIQRLRQSFIEQLRSAQPRFVIEVDTGKPWVSGIDTSYSFLELRALLDSSYKVAFVGDGYLIYERLEQKER